MPTSFELELDDSSPVVRYFPFAETLGAPNLLAGWNSYFTQSGFLSKLGETGLGTSLHVTSLDGAVITIEWFGTGISLFGSAVDATYEISLDGAGPSLGLPDGNTLATFQGLQPKQHLVALVAHPSAANDSLAYLAFDRAALNTSTDLIGATVASRFVPVESSRWVFSGDWTQRSDPVLASEPSQVYTLSTSRANTAYISFNGSAVSVVGVRNVTNGHYNVTLDGTTTTFDGHSDWLETSTLFLQAGLDQTVQHSLTVTNADDASLAISGLNITITSGGTLVSSSSPSPLPIGTIIALVLGVLVAILALASLVVCFYFRRRERHSRKLGFLSNGIRSSVFSDLGTAWSPTHRHKHRPTHLSKNSDPNLQDLYSARPLTAGKISGTDWDRGEGYPTVLINNTDTDGASPKSLVPYLRLSKQSTFKIDLGARERNEEERSRLDRAGQNNRSSVPSAVRELLDAHTHVDSRVHDSSVHMPAIANDPAPMPVSVPKSTQGYSRRRSVTFDLGQPQRLRLHIPNQNPDENLNPSASTPRSARAWRSPLLSTPLRGSRRTTRRSSMGAALFTPYAETAATVSTIDFAQPSEDRRDSRSGSEHTGETEPPPPPLKDPIMSEFVERLKARRAEKNAPPKAGRSIPRPSSWKPPW